MLACLLRFRLQRNCKYLFKDLYNLVVGQAVLMQLDMNWYPDTTDIMQNSMATVVPFRQEEGFVAIAIISTMISLQNEFTDEIWKHTNYNERYSCFGA